MASYPKIAAKIRGVKLPEIVKRLPKPNFMLLAETTKQRKMP